jgi:colanic acid/amylovoran biosynthesis protein
MKKVLLVGLFGTYNYGCEAIVRGSVEILNRKYEKEGCDITLATPNVDDDKKRLTGSGVKIVKRNLNKFKISNILRKAVTKIGQNFPVVIEDVVDLDSYDAVYSIGGDIYTLDHKGEAPLNLMAFGDYCLSKGISYNMLCCSIGPFKDDVITRKFITPHLKRISNIYAREDFTISYLKSIGVTDNVSYLADPAFQVEKKVYKMNRVIPAKVIGVNLSPLSSLHYFSTVDEAVDSQVATISKLLDDTSYSVKLIPHVKSDNENDDDFRYLECIYKKLKGMGYQNIEAVMNDDGFISRKNDLISCDLVIAARMHCAINAICSNVPTIFLSYSKKSIGMSKIVYGSSEFAVELSEFSDLKKLIKLSEGIPEFRGRVEKLQNLNAFDLSNS